MTARLGPQRRRKAADAASAASHSHLTLDTFPDVPPSPLKLIITPINTFNRKLTSNYILLICWRRRNACHMARRLGLPDAPSHCHRQLSPVPFVSGHYAAAGPSRAMPG
ncbi:hypothetical protein E2C01_062000 [Portunus trituberculatus]|uniref:Uncharacterized protein n=1 Tax=Portunus trituberculatus TaxID=210409 RepID=A0A5B7HDX4_PORTR|nr:hypothetical protein [Portunus trituberculatus]